MTDVKQSKVLLRVFASNGGYAVKSRKSGREWRTLIRGARVAGVPQLYDLTACAAVDDELVIEIDNVAGFECDVAAGDKLFFQMSMQAASVSSAPCKLAGLSITFRCEALRV